MREFRGRRAVNPRGPFGEQGGIGSVRYSAESLTFFVPLSKGISRLMQLRRILGTGTALLLAAFVAAGCSAGNSIPENAICTVDGDPIQKTDYKRIIDQARKNYKTQGQKFPKSDSPEYKQLKNQAVDYLIEQELFAQQADELGVKVMQKDVDKRLKQLKESFFKGDKSAYKKELKKQGLTEKEVKDNIKQQLLTEKLFEKVTKTVKVSDAKAQDYFKKNPAQYKQPEQRDVAHILVKKKGDADKIYSQVKGGNEAVFAKIAKKQSQDPSSAQNGGKLTVSRGQTVPEFDKLSFSMKKGEISKPVKTQFGYHIITARGDVKPESKQKFSEVKAQIKQTLEQEQRSKRMQDWRTDLRKDAEENVDCKKGYVWTQTATAKTTDKPPAGTPPTTEDEAPAKGDEKSDKKKSDEDSA